MKTALFLLSVFSVLLSLYCTGTGQDPEFDSTGDQVSLNTCKGVSFNLDIHSDVFEDSLFYRDDLVTGIVFKTDESETVLTSMLVPGCGSTAEDRVNYLETGGLSKPIMVEVPPLGETAGFLAVLYTCEDSSVVERVWNRGAGELAVLQAKTQGSSPNLLLSSVSRIFRTAELVNPANNMLRSVYLSDRNRTMIVEEVNSDVTVPPDVYHSIVLSVNPARREITVVDTLTIYFSPTQSDSQLTLFLPNTGTDSNFESLSGYFEYSGDSVCCVADSSRVFKGLFSGEWTGFISGSTDRITISGLQINPSTSFQCGMWFYPGNDIPASYRLDISVPDMGYRVYAPLQELSRVVSDSLLIVSYSSPEGGIRGPLAWATGVFSEMDISGWRSKYYCHDSDSLALEMRYLADDLASVFWNNMGFSGARLDFVIVRSLDVPVFLTGPGCVFLSSDMLSSIQGYESWSDSLVSGISVPAAAVVFEAARAFLAGSTYLTECLRDAFAAWSVYRFAIAEDNADSAELLEAYMKYYLYTSEIEGGVEYGIADPGLNESPLYDPVVLGKAPVVIEFLTREIPAFKRGIPRALGNLRHSGDSFGRLFSAMGIWESGEFGELFFQWLYSPGIPQIEVAWADSSGYLHIWIEQYQPGQNFPLGSITDDVLIITEENSEMIELTRGSTEGFFSGRIPDITKNIRAINIDPDRILPADIIYRHLHGSFD
ncbi:MAG: hypothetical protein K8R76_10835 [Candidatus Aegiribacteria sp.]|nr:hypothetical protein [Candidatus Aegiribacteria sp.]